VEAAERLSERRKVSQQKLIAEAFNLPFDCGSAWNS
jgi:hypothetical protein